MYEILDSGYEFLSGFLPFLVVLILLRRRRGRYASPVSKGAWALPILFALYILAVFSITGAMTIYELFKENFENGIHINLIPFSRHIDLRGYVLNAVMFLPLGFLVPLIWKGLASFISILLSGFCFSLLIELSQLFSSRATDVDDLIINTLGAGIGFLMYKAWARITGSKFQQEGIPSVELPVYIGVIFLGRFLLFNRMGLIRLLYG